MTDFRHGHDGQDDGQDIRALLSDAVRDVEPRPALARIQNRTKVTPMTTTRTWLLVAAGAAATAATVTGVTLVATNDSTPDSSPEPAATSPADPETSEDPAPEETDTPVGNVTVAVYYLGDTPTGTRLFREFHQVAAGQEEIGMAVAEALTAPPLDPDYSTPWPDLRAGLVDATYDGDEVTIDLTPDPALRDRPDGMTEERARMALEQLMYTAHAAIGEGNDIPVRFLLGGEVTDQVLGVPTSEPLAAGAPMEVQGTVWIIDPQHGDQVGSTFDVTGRGAFFEANVSWQLLQEGEVVKDGFATAAECCTLAEYSFTVEDVEPGDYTLRVYDADMSGGEGPGEQEDTKQITVR